VHSAEDVFFAKVSIHGPVHSAGDIFCLERVSLDRPVPSGGELKKRTNKKEKIQKKTATM
jgi:hypothetical protein